MYRNQKRPTRNTVRRIPTATPIVVFTLGARFCKFDDVWSSVVETAPRPRPKSRHMVDEIDLTGNRGLGCLDNSYADGESPPNFKAEAAAWLVWGINISGNLCSGR